MNKYRTVPGLGPSASQATTATTCQKCLKKGHYSYECKASVQSRPYTSRPSRSQQLQNPKLKPALAEQKMEESKTTFPGPSEALTKAETHKSDQRQNPSEDGQEPSKKRQRSASLSSTSSTATISTNVSDPKISSERSQSTRRGYTNMRSRSPSAARATASLPRAGSHRRRDSSEDQRSHRSESGTQPNSDGARSDRNDRVQRPVRRTDVRHDYRDKDLADHRQRDRPGKRRRSRSAEGLPGDNPRRDVPDHSNRQRSLSPYSRRLALTQAMNAGS